MEYIVLQPLQTTHSDTSISLIHRKLDLFPDEEGLIEHKAGGIFSGFVVKKILPLHLQRSLNLDKCHLSFKLNVFMKRQGNNEDMQHELRILQFWFSSNSDKERLTCSNSFFHNLFKGDNFPKDYFTFLLRVMQIFKALKPISQLKIEFEKLGKPQPISAPIYKITSSVMHLKAEFIEKMSVQDPKQYAAIVTGKILEYLERSFPNPITVDELARLTECNAELVRDFLLDLLARNLVNYYDNGNQWIRNIINVQDEQTHEVKMIQQQLNVSYDKQPTIAIITVNYYEKLAVDAMMEKKVTFVRHKPEGLGESNVYTIGYIGAHRCVSTKIPSYFSRDSRSAKISSGNTTTRLLGIFQRVDHVILVGCAGGVPHYSDFTKHPRRGDIIVSYPESQAYDDETQNFVYAHFDVQKTQTASQVVSKTWMPASNELYKIVNNIRKTYNTSTPKKYRWEEFLEEGINSLYNEELDCRRPSEDKLFFTVGEKSVIEVNHPEDTTNMTDRRQFGYPTLRFGKVGGGEMVARDENLRHSISEQFGIVCFDSGIDQVMESIEGNRKESFMIIRSIVDYIDGTTSKEWQPYASLCAAAFMKTLISELPVSADY